jgi:hypothetical protein
MKRIRYRPQILNGVDMTGKEMVVDDSTAAIVVAQGWADIVEERAVVTPQETRNEPVEINTQEDITPEVITQEIPDEVVAEEPAKPRKKKKS